MSARAARRPKQASTATNRHRHSDQPNPEQLQRENERLQRENEELRRKVAEREEQIAEREKQIADLERQLALRKRNSTNSSKPPSLTSASVGRSGRWPFVWMYWLTSLSGHRR